MNALKVLTLAWQISVCFEILFVALSAIVAINLECDWENVNMTMGKKTLWADFTLLFLQNEDIVHTKQHTQEATHTGSNTHRKQHTQERYISDLSINAILKTKNAKSIIIILKCVDKHTHTHTHTHRMITVTRCLR